MDGFDRFGKRWASSGPVTPASDQQAALGWDYIGSDPPTVQQFNAVQQQLDEKDNWLFGQLAAIILASGMTPAETPNSQVLDALRLLFPSADLAYLYDSIHQVVAATGLTPDNVTPRLWEGINSYFASKAEMAQRVMRSGDTMPWLELYADPANGNRAARRSWVEAVISGKVNRTGDTMPWLAITDPPADWARATNKAYVDGSNAFGVNGSRVSPGGFMVQWGRIAPAERSVSVSLPIVFPTGFPNFCFGCYPTIEINDAGALDIQPGIAGLNQWGATAQIGTTFPEGSISRTFGVYWFAVGY